MISCRFLREYELIETLTTKGETDMTVYVLRLPDHDGVSIRVFWRKSEAETAAKDHPRADIVECEIEGVPLIMKSGDEP